MNGEGVRKHAGGETNVLQTLKGLLPRVGVSLAFPEHVSDGALTVTALNAHCVFSHACFVPVYIRPT